jgi:2,3-bisphosphoglycerate-independent phosphoglycerate mutase
MIIGDGMSDLPMAELGGRTPLEVADCPNMRRLSSAGQSGLLDPLAPGKVAESEEAIMTILGYGGLTGRVRRGPLEAQGAGLTLRKSDLAFRCNFALVSEDLKVLGERVEAPRIDYQEFSESLDEYCSFRWGVELKFIQTWRFKGALVLRGDGLSERVYTPVPRKGQEALGACARDDSPEAKRTVEIVNSIILQSRRVLEDCYRRGSGLRGGSANIMIPWGVGRKLTAQSFQARHGLRGLCIAGAALVRGIGKLLGMSVPSIPGTTGGVDTDTEAKASAALHSSKFYDFILIHVGGPDEASHDGDATSKIAIIEKIDSMLGRVLDRVDWGQSILVLLADHTSSTELRMHTHHPTPIVVADSDAKPDRVLGYSEIAAAEGDLGRLPGAELLQLILARIR